MKIKKYDSLPEDARKIRMEVFVEEQGFEEEFDSTDKIAKHFVLYVEGRAVATCRIFSEGVGRFHLGRVAVLKSERGKGFGKALMLEAEKYAADEEGAECFVLSAQLDKKGFYEALGYKTEGDVYLEEDYPHVFMTKAVKTVKAK